MLQESSVKILMIHNHYQIRGGEDSVFENEFHLLNENDVQIELYVVDNSSLNGFWGKFTAFFDVVFSFKSYTAVRTKIKQCKPDIVHVHNYFPLISPAVFYACKRAGIPVVHTLHNYRAICPTALLMNNGKIEERSINQSPWWSVNQRVYRGSRVGTFVLALMVAWHKRVGTWKTKVDRFIALTQFAANKYEQAGWPKQKLVIKPNFAPDPFSDKFKYSNDNYTIYVGRLSEEKGIDLLLKAWNNINFKLVIIGDGPLKHMVEESDNPNIEYLGRQDKSQVLEYVKRASFLVMASTWYEGFPMVLVEAFACGTCALVPRLGGMQEVVTEGVTGMQFEPGNVFDLEQKIKSLIQSPDKIKKMGEGARKTYESSYTPSVNYHQLINIYQQAILEANSER
jgi:glycosyltransferase involved in cell wall biosynthesis